MALNPDRVLKHLERLLKKRPPLAEGMASVIEQCRKGALSSPIWDQVATLEYDAEARAFEVFVRGEVQPAPESVRGFYVGMAHYDRSPTVRPYVVGSIVPFDPKKPLGWTLTGEWWNSEGTAWRSTLLGRIMQITDADPDERLGTDGHYVLINGFVGLALARMLTDIPAALWCGPHESRPVACGFPGGETVFVGLAERS